jgi:aminoglycoside N3'-acetyltransferase
VLLLGVGYNSNTFHHYVETVTNAPCLYPRGEEYDVIDENGVKKRARTWSWRERKCPINDPPKYAAMMAEFEKTVTLGNCKITYFRARDCFEVVKKHLMEGYSDYPGCLQCPIRPRVCKYSVFDSED